ncbi:hypothetical protein PTTG_08024 [Puccinia triticina 1-1 BBBD Race 1]|uniref:Secreted protein n=2 Tax=Puccinia triticina TaxID=208348 RepID=A0A0C4F4I4_PUCT1|nr:uncharacterized protein PtA15_16A338 [Puccinia triticina]OAV93096.1 hypothetical protein PTTG_08024 [Puccinia triticina 1-1 BBBD Race 1]WAQ92430.1 hypothetical protein PtA15_16A338 [Puccinia triticina]WAR64172.1 hypothetical protein PtB15_16B332 [Puccinia triticina]
MRFALVAGALVLGATVSEGRSIAPSPSKRTTEHIEFATPSRNLKRSRQDSGWNPATETDDVPSNQDGMDPSAYQPKTPSDGKKNAHKASKKHHEAATSDAAYRTALPDPLESTVDSAADTLSKKLPQEIQYQIIPVSSSNSSTQDSPASSNRAYTITPVSPVANAVADVAPDVKEALNEGISSSTLTGMVTHLQTKQESKPAMALLRAIEKYRLAVSEDSKVDVNDAQSRSTTLPKPTNIAKSVLSGSPLAHTPHTPASSLLDSTPAKADPLTQLPGFIPANTVDPSSLTNTIDPLADSTAAWNQ